MELFVQEGCLTCPTAEFCLEDLAWEYGTSKFILVQEHLWGDGYDTAETNARYNWCVGDGKKGTPDVFIDGLTKRLQGLYCDCVEGNYECYKDAIDDVLKTGEQISKHNIGTIIIDVEDSNVKLEICKKLAKSANAAYYHIDNLNNEKLNEILTIEGVLEINK